MENEIEKTDWYLANCGVLRLLRTKFFADELGIIQKIPVGILVRKI